MSNVFLQAAFLQPPIVAGKQLRPLSLWHMLCLIFFDSPAQNGLLLSDADYLTLFLICQDEKKDGLLTFRKFTSSRWEKFCLNIRFAYYGWGKVKKRLDAYLACYLKLPRVFPGQSSRVSHCPWPINVVWTLGSKLHGATLDELWNMPVNMAMVYKVRNDEGEGATLVDELEQEHDEYVAKNQDDITSLNKLYDEKLKVLSGKD